jgi:hypothetical protein
LLAFLLVLSLAICRYCCAVPVHGHLLQRDYCYYHFPVTISISTASSSAGSTVDDTACTALIALYDAEMCASNRLVEGASPGVRRRNTTELSYSSPSPSRRRPPLVSSSSADAATAYAM